MSIHTVGYTYILHYGYVLILLHGYIYLWMGVLIAVCVVGIMHIRQYSHTHGNT